jgi:DNA-binding response OmpR family regulator/KaiC/GvpD/RAD55 family RecA-like ATPase
MSHKILVADDDPDIRDLISATLRSAGYEVLVAQDGEQALALAQQERPLLAVLDITMPKLSGFQVTAALRENPTTAGIAIIIVSARGAESDRITGFEEGADDYLVKPFSPRELQLRVAVLMARQVGTTAQPAPIDRPASGPATSAPPVPSMARAVPESAAYAGADLMLPQISIGHAALDRALGGGLPHGSNILLTGEIGSGKSTLCRQFIANGLLQNERAMFIALDDAPFLIRRSLDALLHGDTVAYEERNFFRMVDAYSWSAGGAQSHERYSVSGILELNQLSGVVQDAGGDLGQTVRTRLGGRRVLDSISSLLVHFELPSVQRFLSQVARNAVAFGGVSTLFVLEEGTCNDQTLANIKYLMDGVIETRIESGHHLARIASMKWTQHSRDWIAL